MEKYRKKPVVIDAVQMDEKMFLNRDLLPEGVHIGFSPVTHFYVHTLEGVMDCPPKGWLIKGVKGELYFCADDIFRMTYDKA